ncbi:MAG: malate synthase [Bacteroidota bacterium]
MKSAEPTDTKSIDEEIIELGHGVTLRKEYYSPRVQTLFTESVVKALSELHRSFNEERQSLLWARKERQDEFDQGAVPTYLAKDSEAVTGDWKVRELPEDLLQRRVEITGPVNSAKMVINMLSRNDAGDRADMAMLDFEDSMKPTWLNVIDGVHNVMEAAKGTLEFVKPASGDQDDVVYKLDPEDMAGLMVRVRGLHLNEEHVRVDGEPIPAGLFDLALCYLHAAELLIERHRTPKFYVPKCEHYLEARWWDKLFTGIEEIAGHEKGTLRATFLIETLPAAFQVEEILYALREHAAGLNVGRWDKIFSDIKVLRTHADRIMPDRATINMEKPWMDQYAKRLIKICHERGALAIGGMSAFTPGKNEELRKEQTAKVVADKQNEFDIGHDGCWVSHPYFITPAMQCFPQKNQLDRTLPDQDRYPELLPEGGGPITEDGLRTNIRVGIGYMQGWNQDIGCVAWDNLMEDLATLEISRAQTWQWLHHQVSLDDGRMVTKELVETIFDEELIKIYKEVAEVMNGSTVQQTRAIQNQFRDAKEMACQIFTLDDLPDFLHDALERIQL